VAQKIFQLIKIAISKESILAHTNESQPYTLETFTLGAAMVGRWSVGALNIPLVSKFKVCL
jgi:hypothetical protein